MATIATERAAIARARRVVVKVGSRALATDDRAYQRLAESIAHARKGGRSVILVSSGAIALGTKKLGYRSRPKEMARLQAAAAAGQSALMRAYEDAFSARGITVAQVLLTHSDLSDRVRGNNARAALAALLDAGAVPILNENDSVAVEEIKFGDNDQLASMVAPLVDADVVVLLSDVAGLLDARGERVSIVRDVERDALPLVKRARARDSVGSGGMASKLEAARRANLAGAHVVIADAREDGTLEAVLAGEDVGTLFVGARERLSAKKHWIAFTRRAEGTIVLDRGAALAVRTKGKSVLAVGVLGVRGDFRAGDAVRIVDSDGVEMGRGLARLAAIDALAATREDAKSIPSEVVIHRDEMVIWKIASSSIVD